MALPKKKPLLKRAFKTPIYRSENTHLRKLLKLIIPVKAVEEDTAGKEGPQYIYVVT